MINYTPLNKDYPKLIDVSSAWGKIPQYIWDILGRFDIKRDVALEFGVERGYSTSCFANYFKRVIGVDPFNWNLGDKSPRGFYDVLKLLKDYPNIQLIPDVFEQFIQVDIFQKYDLIHIDIGYETHDYEPTLACGEWAVQHSDCVLFHDTISFPGVHQACEELSAKYGFKYYNYAEEIGPAGIVCGLGILIKTK
jgi:hypothetical protein